MQALFRNPMADAWSLGLVAGGQLGVGFAVAGAAFAGPAVLLFLTSFAGLSLTLGAVIGVAATAAAMAALARRVGNITLLVVGLMLGFTAQGLVSVILHFASRVGGACSRVGMTAPSRQRPPPTCRGWWCRSCADWRWRS